MYVFILFSWLTSSFLSQKKTFCIYWQAKYTFFRPTNALHLRTVLSRNSRPVYLKSIFSVSVLGKLFKNVFFPPKVNKYGDDFLHFKFESVRQKNGGIFKFTFMYCKTNCSSYCHKYIGFPASCAHVTQHKFQRCTRCNMGEIR